MRPSIVTGGILAVLLYAGTVCAGGNTPALPLRQGTILPADTGNSLIPPARGVDIQSGDPHVFSVSGGKVTAVFPVTGTWSVLVQKGNTYFVYGNLSTASVCKGDSIAKGEQVGALDGEKNVLQFQIWETGYADQAVASWQLNEVAAFLKGVNQ